MTALLRLAPGTAPRNGLTWKPYRYRGTGEDTLTGFMDRQRKPVKPKRPTGRPLSPCGTVAAFRRHKRRHEEPCEACRAERAAYERRYRQRNRGQEAAA